jgi:hypothetical protein
MRKWALPLLLIVLQLIPLGVYAQTPLTLSSLQVQIWPEYDKPSVLVIYNMTLSDTTTYPAEVSVRIPSAAGQPFAVADRQPDGKLYNISYSLEEDGDWVAINFTATSPDIRIEYYDPGISTDGNARHFQYVWPGDYAVSQFLIEVQQPAGATDMSISPSLGPGTTRPDTLVYYTQDIGAIPAGQNISITMDYNKTTDTLTAETVPVEPSAPIPQSTPQDFNLTTWLPWILGIIGAGLIIGGILWFWQSGKQRPASGSRRRRSKSSTNEPGLAVNTTEDSVYCSQCGKRASPGDLFCRSCGAQIRNK